MIHKWLFDHIVIIDDNTYNNVLKSSVCEVKTIRYTMWYSLEIIYTISAATFFSLYGEDLNQFRTTDTPSFPLCLPPGKGNPSRPRVTDHASPSTLT